MIIHHYVGIFVTGILSGGVSCMAVQGGLLTATIASMIHTGKQENTRRTIILATGAFLAAKLVIHTLFGALLGLFGETIAVSISVTSGMLLLASLFMIGSAFNILGVHPIFRYFVIQPPRFLTRYIRSQSKTGVWFAPFFLGLLTIFIPCGVTQAMMVDAIATGSPFSGALTLFSFILGTTVVFLVGAFAIGTIPGRIQGILQKVGALLVLLLALWNMWNVFGIWGFATRMETLARAGVCQIVFCDDQTGTRAEKQAPTTHPIITITAQGYEVDNAIIPRGGTIELTVTNTTGNSCIQVFTIPAVGIYKVIPVGTTEKFTFQVPKGKTEIPFSCSMGMYRGTLYVE